MPKNVIGRLLNLENEIKSVLSICEVSNNEQKSNRPVQKRGKSLIRNSLSNADHTRCSSTKLLNGKLPFETEKSVQKSHEKEKKPSGCQRRKSAVEKPNSAPSGALSATSELEKSAMRKVSVQRALENGEGVVSVDSLEWFDCSPQTCETSEQTLRPAEEILTDIAQYGNENYLPKQLMLFCGSCRRRALDCICHGKHRWTAHYLSIENHDKQAEITRDQSKESFLQHIKPDLKDNTIINELAKKIEESENEVMSAMQEHRKIACRTIYGNASLNEVKKGITRSEDKRQPRVFHDEPRLLDSTRRPDVNSISSGRPMTAPVKSPTNETHSTRRETTKSSVHLDRAGEENSGAAENSEESEENKPLHWEVDHSTENENIKRLDDKSDDRNYAHWIKQAINEQQDLKSDGESSANLLEDLENLKKRKSLSQAATRKIAELIEKNYIKVEKMRRSRILALNTVKYMTEKYETLSEMKNDLAEKLEMLIEKNEKLMKELQEADDMKQRMSEEWEKQKHGDSTHLINTLQRLNEENMRYKETIQLLERQLQERIRSDEERANNTELTEKISEAFQMNHDKCYEYHLLCRKQETAYQRLVQGIAILEKVIRNNKEKEKRLSYIKAELKRRAIKTQCHLEKLTAEKTNLFHVVNELQAYVEENQSRIEQLQEEISKRDEEIENRKKMMEEKTETLEETNRELASIRENSNHLENQVKTLRNSIDRFDQMHQNLLREREEFEEIVRKVKEENGKLQEQISVEKESILIKDKIIEDQQDTIKQLREKSEESKAMVNKVQSLERLLDAEREEKLELQETVERLRWKKDELKHKVKSLEADLLLAPQEVVRDLQKTQIFLHELENQVQTKQKEWEVLVQSLAKEKEEACSVAVFATKKLIQTTSDFQRQSEAYKKLYKILTENLMERKKQLQEENEKAKQSVRFSEDLLQQSIDGYDEEVMRNPERFRYQAKQLGILKKNKEWFENLPESSNGRRGKSACETDDDLE